MSATAHFFKEPSPTKLRIMAVVGSGINDESPSAVKSKTHEYAPQPITEQPENIIYTSIAMQNIIRLCDRVAASEASILISGESGTGKEIIAKYIHKKSKRTANAMISINCAAIPDNLLESELFGHEKGAFSGAIAKRIGKFEEANGSTLLLDEISEMDLRLQAKLLRAIQEREIDRVGGNKPIKIDIRIIATSNRDLQSEVKKGNFREDLYHRLNVINVYLPPLRARKEDIRLFVNHFIKKYAKINGVRELSLSNAAIAKLENYHFPGNVRELENILHRALLVTMGNEIIHNDIMLSNDTNNNTQPAHNTSNNLVGRTMESVEKELIINTITHCIGNRTHAANILGISIRTLHNKLKEYAAV